MMIRSVSTPTDLLQGTAILICEWMAPILETLFLEVRNVVSSSMRNCTAKDSLVAICSINNLDKTCNQ